MVVLAATPSTPPLAVANVPPWMVAPDRNCTTPVPDAEIVPPELLVVALICRKALVDSSSPWFTIEFGFRSRAAPATLPFTIPALWLTKDNPLLPICPRPWIVLLTLVSTAPLPDSLIIAVPPPVVDMVTVPAPVRLTLPDTERNVLFAAAFT